MVELETQVYDFAQSVLDDFDPLRARAAKLSQLEESLQQTREV